MLAPTDGEEEDVDEDSATDITEGVPVPRREAWAARDNDDEKTTAHSRLRGTTHHAEKARGDGEGGLSKILGLDSTIARPPRSTRVKRVEKAGFSAHRERTISDRP